MNEKTRDLRLGEGVASAVDWLQTHAQPLFDSIRFAIGGLTDLLEWALLGVPIWAFSGVLVVLAAWRVGLRFAAFTSISLALVAQMGLWPAMVSTLVLVAAATLLGLVIGLPLGILGGKERRGAPGAVEFRARTELFDLTDPLMMNHHQPVWPIIHFPVRRIAIPNARLRLEHFAASVLPHRQFLLHREGTYRV
jgi:hypothetical protein